MANYGLNKQTLVRGGPLSSLLYIERFRYRYIDRYTGGQTKKADCCLRFIPSG